MTSSGIVTLLTDFGTADSYVAAMKGVLLSWHRRLTIVDLTHEIRPQDILQAAFVARGCVFEFPLGTVHLLVVDPGVGTSRRLLGARVDGQYLLCPDNGLLDGLQRGRTVRQLTELTWRPRRSGGISQTFHGRDILAPIAARLASGQELSRFGRRTTAWQPLPLPSVVRRSPARLEGRVVHIDRFGNLITNVSDGDLRRLPRRAIRGIIRGRTITRFVATYASGRPREVVGVIGSQGLLELAVRNGSAERLLGARRNDPVILRST